MEPELADHESAHFKGDVLAGAPADKHASLEQIRAGLRKAGIPFLSIVKLLAQHLPEILAMLSGGISIEKIVALLKSIFEGKEMAAAKSDPMTPAG